MRMWGGRMIVNPVRYGSGKPKQVEVQIRTSSQVQINLYCIKDGKYTDYYNGDSPNTGTTFSATVDAGSLFVVIAGSRNSGFSSRQTNCTLETSYKLASGYPLGIFKANDA